MTLPDGFLEELRQGIVRRQGNLSGEIAKACRSDLYLFEQRALFIPSPKGGSMKNILLLTLLMF
ncbi:MAG: hypothetical protein PHF12_05605, partial [Candidatus Omnitrophica bacterium]|nr:hypothetical protein [Candidatus Omnitrophota bacterium]